MDMQEEDKNKKMVVYCIENKASGKKYVGITKNKLRQRIIGHRTCCKRGFKTAIYDAMRSIGEENFKIYILQQCESEEALVKAELSWIKKLRSSTTENGYNILTDEYIFGKTTKGKKISEKRKKKLSERMLRLRDEYLELHQKDWVVVSPSGDIIEITNLQKFCRENKIDAPNMVKLTTTNKGHFHKGWQCFKKEEFDESKVLKFYNGFRVYFDDGRVEEFVGSFKKYSEINSYDLSALCKLKKGKAARVKNIIKIEPDYIDPTTTTHKTKIWPST